MKRSLILTIFLGCLLGAFLLAACNGGGNGGSDLEPFNTSCFPLDIPGTDGGWANIAFDGEGNLIIPCNVSGEVLSVDRQNCVLSTLATVPAVGQMYTIVYDPGTDAIYVGDTDGGIYAVNPSSGASTLLVDLDDYINALVVAPEGYGSFGGQLLAALRSGLLMAVDPSTADTTQVADFGGNISDVEFASDGTLYAVLDAPGDIITIQATGMSSVFVTGFTELDGIAVNEVDDWLLVSDSDEDMLYAVQISDGARTALGAFDFDSGWYPSGLAFDGVNTVLMSTGEDTLVIESLTF